MHFMYFTGSGIVFWNVFVYLQAHHNIYMQCETEYQMEKSSQ